MLIWVLIDYGDGKWKRAFGNPLFLQLTTSFCNDYAKINKTESGGSLIFMFPNYLPQFSAGLDRRELNFPGNFCLVEIWKPCGRFKGFSC